MDSRTYQVEVEEIPLSDIRQEEQSISSEDEHRQVNLRRACTDVHMSPRNTDVAAKCHSYSGREHRLKNTMPSRSGVDFLGSHLQHYGADRRPSAWFNTVIARRRKGVTPQTEEEALDEITEAMGGDEKLMSDDIDGKFMRREALRELCKPLKVKKEIRRRLTARQTSSRTATRTISGWKSFKYTMSMHWYKMIQSVRDTFHDYSLWHKDLKEIEGTFGTGVGSYFRFLRYLFILNLVISLLVSGFLLTPQLLVRLSRDSEEPTDNNTASLTLTDGIGIKADFLIVSDSMIANRDPAPSQGEELLVSEGPHPLRKQAGEPTKFGPVDWLTGSGWFQNTELYYGSYLNGTFSLVSGQEYNIAEAYFFIILLSLVSYLVMILHRVIVLYKNNYIDTVHDMSSTFIKKVFSSWDFTITEKKAASIKHRSIYNELTELLQEYLNEEIRESFVTRLMALCVKLVFWAIVCGFLSVLGWAMYLLLSSKISEDVAESTSSDLSLLIYPLIVTLIMIIVPVAFEGLVNIEGYRSPRHKLYVTLIRTILLELTILGVLIGFWYTPHEKNNAELSENAEDTLTIKEDDCWETSLGEEIYRLLIIDFLIGLLMNAAVVFFSFATKNKSLGRPQQYLLEFNISRNTLHLIYNQTLLWAGLFFCPLTPLIVLLKMVITFYIQKFIILSFMRADERPWRAAQTETVFFALTLVSLILNFLAYGFIVIRGYCSSSCGPFQGYPHYVDFVWTLTQDQGTILSVISWILQPGVVAGILGLLLILVYCAKSMADGRAEMIQVLRQQLELEVKDRAFLLQLTDRVRRGEYKPSSPKYMQSDSLRGSPFTGHHPLTQRGSFIFSDSKVHPADEGMGQRFFGNGGEFGPGPSSYEFSQ
ncbi:transmembrane channel-like protein 7 isoform X2 [Palaemon carinicauda]|uniref:transmembrane channel-like protein 7 isoform X2 n=1 Tax=Palaemon carinicauda TaxID=392227 RepID=UPI0035B64061